MSMPTGRSIATITIMAILTNTPLALLFGARPSSDCRSPNPNSRAVKTMERMAPQTKTHFPATLPPDKPYGGYWPADFAFVVVDEHISAGFMK
jgi:hypothetical protein